MIKRLRLENWKSHLSTELDFDAGPNVLVGIMGSGKTSVVEALSFALFGTFPGLQSKRMALDELLMSRPERRDKASVEIEFESNGKIYSVRREIRRGRSSRAEIREDGKLLEINPRSVTETVGRLLGMDYELFSKAVYSEQNGIDYFLRIPKGQRMGHIDRMLKLERYEKAREGCVALRNKVKAKASELMKVVEDIERARPAEQLARVEGEAGELGKEEARLGKCATALGREIGELESRLKAIESGNKELEDTRRDLEAAKAGLMEMETSIKQREKRLEGKETPGNVEELLGELKRLEKETEGKRKTERELREQLASLSTGIRMLREREIPELHRRYKEKEAKERALREIESRFPDMADLGRLEDGLERLRRETHGLESRISELGGALAALKGRKCPTCEQDVTDELRQELERKRREELASTKAALSEKSKELQKRASFVEEMEAAANERSALLSQLKDYENIKPRLSEVEKTVEEGRRKTKSLVEDIGKVSKEAAELDARTKKKSGEAERAGLLLEEAGLLRELKKRKQDNAMRKAGLEKRLEGLREALKGTDLPALRKELTEKSSEGAAVSARLSSLSMLLKEKETLLKELNERVKTLLKYRETVEESEKVMDVLDRLGGVLSVTQQQLREEFIKSVNSIMNSLWPDIYPYGDFSEVRLGVEGDYVLQLKRGDEWLSADGIASGGERSLACLVLRIAFSLAFMPKLRWLILDEPTHNLDRNAVERLAEAVRERPHAFAEQIFVITHDERLSEGMPAIRLERNKASGGHTRARVVS